jgi:protein TonB
MKKTLSTAQSNDYLKALEAEEKGRRRKKLFIVGAIGLVIGGAAFAVPQVMPLLSKSPEQQPNYRSFYATELTDDKVRDYFEEANNRMVVRYPGEKRRDTVVSYTEYTELISRRSNWEFNVVSNDELFAEEEGMDEGPSPIDDALQAALGTSTPEPLEASAEASEEGEEAAFGFRVRGNQVAGEELSIQIVNYRSDVEFEMDFGDGNREKIDRTTRFSYNKPGNYVISLRAKGEGVASQVYATFPITIASPESEQPQFAQVSNPSTNDDNGFNAVPAVKQEDFASEEQSIELPQTIEPLEVGETEDNAANNTSNTSASSANSNPTTPVSNPVVPANQPFFSASKMPSFPGGRRGLSRFIQRNVRYPQISQYKQKQGKVDVRFIVDENGRVTNPQIIKGLGEDYNKEVLRVLSRMPRWSPGEQNGKKVPVYQQLRVSFDIQN